MLLAFGLVMSGMDRISGLPEPLLTQILSFLPTKQSVQTSVLSKSWENLYLSVPGLDLDCSSIPDQVFLTFIDKFLGFSPESVLFKVKVKCRDTVIDGFSDRIGIMIDRGTHHLDIEDNLHYSAFGSMPMNLFTSKTLVYLKLTSSVLQDPSFVFMPCLKSMHLEEIKGQVHLDTLISGCPVLEELTLLRDPDDDKFKADLLVRTQSLKRLRVLPLRNGYVGRRRRRRVKCALEIDAPGLEHMSLGDDQIDSIVVKNLSCLFDVELDIKFVSTFNLTGRSETDDFLNGISGARHMIISAKTMQTLVRYSQLETIPRFNNLSCLQAVFPSDLLQFLPVFLEHCPNLKHLVLKVVHSKEMEGLELTDVPRCVSLTLECVEIQEKIKLKEGKMKVVASYFFENSPVLKKLIMSVRAPYKPRDVMESEIYEKVNKLTKRSPGCEIIVRVRAMKED